MSLFQIFEWLGSTGPSIMIRESAWTYPIVETMHVLGLALFLGLVAFLDLRLIGAAIRDTPVSEVQRRLFPWTMAGLALMVVTGLLLFYSDPLRFYRNIFFWIKIVLLAFAALNALLFHGTVYRHVAEWDLAAITPVRARIAGIVSLVLWVGVVFAGRFIAYNWFN